MNFSRIFDFLGGLFGKTKNTTMNVEKSRDAMNDGIDRAVSNANRKHKDWSDKAYNFLLDYAKNHSEFLIEDVRVASVGVVPTPPSERAWGGITVRAVKEGVIKRKSFKNVKNIKAHRTPATFWEVI